MTKITDQIFENFTELLLDILHFEYIEKALRESQILRAGCNNKIKGGAKNFRPAADPLPVGAGRPKFNQLEMVTTFTYKPSLVRIDACNFELSW